MLLKIELLKEEMTTQGECVYYYWRPST